MAIFFVRPQNSPCIYHFSVDFNRFRRNRVVAGSSPCFIQKLFRAFAIVDQTEGSPFIFFDNMHQTEVLKSPKGLPIYIFRHSETFKILIFRLKIGFLNIYTQIIFFTTIRYFDVTAAVKRYIRIFDVISKLYCVSQRRRWMFENEFFMKTSYGYFKNFFLSLRYSADLGRSRLVHYQSIKYSVNQSTSQSINKSTIYSFMENKRLQL